MTTDPQPIAPSDLRAGDRVRVTVEGVVSSLWDDADQQGIDLQVDGADYTTTLDASDLRSSTIHLLAREPEPLMVGESVCWGNGSGVLRAIYAGETLVEMIGAVVVHKPLCDLYRLIRPKESDAPA